MTNEEYLAAIQDVIYLDSCAVNGTIPDAARLMGIDLECLYKAANRHLLTGITAMALESAGIRNETFQQAKGKAIRKVAAFDMERAAVLAALEESGIWYMPLKGSVLKSLYPKIGMRQMADNDIIYDASRTAQVRTLMERLGFKTDKTYGQGIHDEYFKPPVCNFEMHRALFGAGHDEKLVDYYRDVKSRMILNSGSSYGYHLSDEDFYIYMNAHEYKHYSSSGTGLRSLLDTYVYLKQKSDCLDWTYIEGETEKLGITDFERGNRSLSLHLFSGEELTAQDREMLDFILSSGTYGTLQNRVHNQIQKHGGGFQGKVKYVFSRIFLPMNIVRSAFPLFVKYPVLLPFLPIYRILRGITVHRDRLATEWKALVGSRLFQDP